MSPPVPFPRRAPRGRFGTEPPPSQRIALVSGANRGLGLEVSRQLAAAGMTVLLGARNLAAGEKAAKALRREGGDVTAVQLDVTAQADVDALAERIERDFGRLDVLVNNAGAYFNLDDRASSVDLAYVSGATELSRVHDFEARLGLFESPPFEVESFGLYSSWTRKSAPNLYRLEAEYALNG